jgi:capsular exopolysaccharide synthesis family protein
MTAPPQDVDIRHVLAVIRSRAAIITGLVVVSTVASFLFSVRSAPLFESTATVRVSNPNSENVFQSMAQAPVDPKRQVETETRVLQSRDLRTAVDEGLGPRSADVTRVAISNPTSTDLLDIAVTSTSAETARDAANLYADTYVKRRRERAASELDRRASELRLEADRLSNQIRDATGELAARPADADTLRAQIASLQNQQNTASNIAFQLGAQAALNNGAVEVADSAALPAEPVAPKPLRNAALAGILALLAGVGGAILFDRLDDRITSPEDLTGSLADVPVLASIPIHSGEGRRGSSKLPQGARELVPLNSVTAEVYRTLRSNVRYSSIAEDNKILMVTSSSGSEGKSTVTANLAVALAESGQRVVVVSADLRRPTLSSLFGINETERGVTSVLHGEMKVADCLAPVTLESGHRMYVLPAGPLPHNPAELLGSRMMGELLTGLAAADVDYVLVDCPPVLPVSDPLAVAQYVDGVILLAVVGQTRIHSLTEAHDRLTKVGADVLGIVLNGVPTARGKYPYYYYRRYDQYGYASTDAGHDLRDKPAPPDPTNTGGNGRETTGVNGGRAVGHHEPGAPPPPDRPLVYGHGSTPPGN